MAGDLGGLRDDGADELAAEGDRVGLQHRQLRVGGAGQPRGVLVGEHGQHAGHGFGAAPASMLVMRPRAIVACSGYR